MTTATIVRGPEVRTYRSSFELRDVGATLSRRFIEGRAVPYGAPENMGWYLEEHTLGEFTRTITDHPDLPLLLFHDSQTWPVGVADEWRDNEAGLDCVWRLDGSVEAQRAAQLAADGMLTGLSIGFIPIRSEWEFVDDDEWDPAAGVMDRVTRLESRLLEVSLTPTPAFADAQVSLVRSREPRRAHGKPAARPRVDETRRWLAGRSGR